MEKTLTIEHIGPAGDGIAHLDDGAPAFIPLSAPGDVVRTTLKQDHAGLWRGQINEIVTAGEVRVTPPCRHYGQCGGCSLQHVSTDFYRTHKKDVVAYALEKAGVATDRLDDPIIVPPGTRRRATFSFVKKGRVVTIGFNGRRSHDVMAIPGCLVLDPAVLNVVEQLKTHLPTMVAAKSGDIMVQHVDGQIEVSLTTKLNEGLAFYEAQAVLIHEVGITRINARAHERHAFDLLLESGPLMKSFGPLQVNLPAATFLQPSDAGEKILTDLVMEMTGTGKNIADLFCGCGTFAGPLSTKSTVAAIDSDIGAIQALMRATGGIPVTPQVRNLMDSPLSAKELKVFDAVVMDPPRAGAKDQCAEVAKSNVRTVVYVSCSPQSFARDAKTLVDGGYQLKRVQPVDQFTWSAHGEVVSLFEKI